MKALLKWPLLIISIHALRVEGDCNKHFFDRFAEVKFLSTPSGWRATTRNSV